ncbi:tetratricopeptide repeat protein [Bradyrhizobium sp. LjRoot220]|uniref:caspase family protein n=1 Tax=Bradyrhizobium sp. LjRoot220 TaxID=3342284 RepID=UPI003ED0A571
MLRAILLAVVTLAAAVSARAAGDIDTCRNQQAEPAARLAACETVIADDKITGKPRAGAFWVRGDSLMKKRDYDGAIAAFSAALDVESDNAAYLNARGLAYGYKGDDERALADYERSLKLRPNYASPYNNRGLIFMRKGDLDRAFAEFDASVKLPANNTGRYIHLFNRARVQTYRQQYEAALADFAEAQKLDPEAPQVAIYRCITYTAMGKFDQALADCNATLAKTPTSIYTLTNRGNIYRAKGDLDAALKDYDAALKINPNYIRAHAYRGQLFEKRRDEAAARADYRAASAALTKFDEIDTAIARRLARERLAVLMGTAPPPSAAAKPAPGKTAAPVPSGPRKVALIVGNSAYRNVQPLANPARDAKLIASTLRELGFATVTLAPDLTRDKFFAALHEFGTQAEKADWAVVYYAGHGMEIGGVNYLIPTDAKLAADRDAETQAVALEQLIAAVSGARKLRLVILDACRDNPFQKTMQRTIALKLVNKGFSNIEPEAGFMVVYAAKHGETALDGDSVNSPFATVLARELRTPKVEVRKLFDIVRDDVWTMTKRAQQPFTYGSPPGREDFYFVVEK